MNQHKGKIFIDMDIFKQLIGIYPELTIEDIQFNDEFKGAGEQVKEGIVITTSIEFDSKYYAQTQPYTEGGPVFWTVIEEDEYLRNVKPFVEKVANNKKMTMENLCRQWLRMNLNNSERKWKYNERIWEVSEQNRDKKEISDKEWLQQMSYILMPEKEVLQEDKPEGTGEAIEFSATYMKHICERLARVAEKLEEK